jgi:hypothetical protein
LYASRSRTINDWLRWSCVWPRRLRARLHLVHELLKIIESTHELGGLIAGESGYDYRKGGMLHAALGCCFLCEPMFTELAYLLYRYHLDFTDDHLRLAGGLCQQSTEFDSPFAVHASRQREHIESLTVHFVFLEEKKISHFLHFFSYQSSSTNLHFGSETSALASNHSA